MQSGQQHCSTEPSWSLRERARLSFIYRGLVSNLVAGFEYRDSINRAVYELRVTTCYISDADDILTVLSYYLPAPGSLEPDPVFFVYFSSI